MQSITFAVFALVIGADPHGPWKVEDFPDPVTQPLLCGRNVSGWICDPDRFLSPEALNEVDESLRSISTQTSVLCGAGKLPFQMGVAVLGSLDQGIAASQAAVPDDPDAVRALGSWGPKALAKDAQRFTEQLGNTWAIGQERCNNGVMLLIVANDHVAMLKTGPGARDSLPDDHVIDILNDMRASMRAGEWEKAVQSGVRDVGLALRGEYRKAPELAIWIRLLVIVLGSGFLIGSPALLACMIYPFVYCCIPEGSDKGGELKQLSLAPRRLLRLYIGEDDEPSPNVPSASPLQNRATTC